MSIAKVLSAFIGVLIVIGSLGILGAGTVALSANDRDGFLTTGPIRITTELVALRTGDESFWVADATDGGLSWDIENGRWAMAVINADGTPGVDADVIAAAQIPFIQPIGIALVVIGMLGLVVGVTLTYLGVRSTPNHQAAPVEAKGESLVV